MSIELDRARLPQHDGKPGHFAECEERCSNLYRGRIGKPEQKATALHLRSGLSGPACEAARKLKREALLTADEEGKAAIDGAKLLLTILKKNAQDIAPLRSTEKFDTALYESTVWRQRNESMAE